jgi:hypothetical protein
MLLFFYLCVTMDGQGQMTEERRHIGVNSIEDACDLLNGWNQWMLMHTKDTGTFYIPDGKHCALPMNDSSMDLLTYQISHGIEYYLLPVSGKVG